MEKSNKPLSDWLIASDIDGTLNNKLRLMPKRNYKAIQKFVYDFGGNFVLASGRSIESMRYHYKKLNLKSGYAVFTNGAGIYDYANEKILWLCPMKENLVDVVKAIAEKHKFAKVQIVKPTEVCLVKPDIAAYFLAWSSKLKIKKFKSISDVPPDNWCKVIFTGTPAMMKTIYNDFISANNGESRNLMFSSIFSFEVVSFDTNKGIAVLKTAEILGVDKNKTSAIGDYFNDYQMLKNVAVPACCGQAPYKLKEIAKLVTCHCNKGAVAELIEYLISNRDNL
ncbi:MAG: HAD family phosphatase [Clostridia bacterium]|nr:HAD family phosphatase [Clostridia bacterium]